MSDSQGSASTMNVHFEEYIPVSTDQNLDAMASPPERKPESLTHASTDRDDVSQTRPGELQDLESNFPHRKRRPLTLHPLVGWGLILVCLTLTVVVSILYWLSQQHNGLFNVYPIRTFRDEVVQLIWSSGPTSLMTILTGFILAPIVFDLWLYAPYAELERGGATAQTSILANYTVLGELERIWRAFRNRKLGLVTLGIAALLSGLLPIAASGLLETKNIMVPHPVRVPVTAMPGIWPSTDGSDDKERNHIFLDSNHYMEAASSAVGQRAYQPLSAPFTYQSSDENWSITPLKQTLPIIGHEFDLSAAANLTVETYGIKMDANCLPADVTVAQNNTAIATLNGCSYNFTLNVTDAFTRWHLADSVSCNEASRRDDAFRAFVYALYKPALSYVDAPPENFVVMFCQPSMSVAKVSATLSVTQQDGIGALVAPPQVLESFEAGKNASDRNVTGLLDPPLNGFALNGWDITEYGNIPTYSRITRVNITKELLYEGIYSIMHNRNNPAHDWFIPENRRNLQNSISDFYQDYVSTFSRSAYYNPLANDTIITGSLVVLVTRASTARLNAIALASLLFILACLLAVTLVMEPRPQRYGDGVQLAGGTLAEHAIASQGPLMEIIRRLPWLSHDRIAVELQSRRFSTSRGKVVVEATPTK